MAALLVSTAAGQWVDKTLFLGGATAPQLVVFDHAGNTAYFAGSSGDCLLAVDGSTGWVLRRTPLPGRPRSLLHNPSTHKLYCSRDGGVTVVDAHSGGTVADIPLHDSRALALSVSRNKIYCARRGRGDIAVIDGMTDEVIDTIAVGDSPTALLYVPTLDRLYCADSGSDDIRAVDCATNTVTAVVPAGNGPFRLLWAEVENKVYCANRESDDITVVDCEGDTAVATVPAGDFPHHLCYNPSAAKVYCANRDDSTVTVIDASADTVKTVVAVGDGPSVLVWVGTSGTVYCANWHDPSLSVLDGFADTLVAQLLIDVAPVDFAHDTLSGRVYGPTGSHDGIPVFDDSSHVVTRTTNTWYWPLSLCYNPVENKLYCGDEERREVLVLDGTTDSVLGAVASGYDVVAMCCDSINNRVYCTNPFDSSLTAIDGSGDTLIVTVPVGAYPQALCFEPVAGRIYCANTGSNTVTVVDGATSGVVATIPVGMGPRSVCCRSSGSRVYTADLAGNTVTVIDATTNTVMTQIPVGSTPTALAYGTAGDELYCLNVGSHSVTVIDCSTNAVIATVPTGSFPYSLLYSPGCDKLFTADLGDGTVTVIDAAADTVLATTAVSPDPFPLVRNPHTGKVYCADDEGPVVSVISEASNRCIATVEIGDEPEMLVYNSARRRVCSADYASSSVTFVADTGFDVGVVAVIEPLGSYQQGDLVQPSVRWRNLGSHDADFEAWVRVRDPSGARVYSNVEQVTGLGAGEDIVLTRFDSLLLLVPGEWQVRCSTAYEFDGVPANDRLVEEFRVNPAGPGWSEQTSIPAGPSGKPVRRGGWLVSCPADGRIYAAKGYKTGDFYRYDAVTDYWERLDTMPWRHGIWSRKAPGKGARGAADDCRYLYATQGNNSLGFWRYDANQDSWSPLPDVPEGPRRKKVKGGTDIVFLTLDGIGYVYLLKGYGTEFYRFNVLTEEWGQLADAPVGQRAKWNRGSWLVANGDSMSRLYAHKARYSELWCYDVKGDSWGGPLAGMPLTGVSGRRKKSKDGGSAAWYDGRILALKGGNTGEFWMYDVAGDAWSELDTMPAYGSTGVKKRVKHGADLAHYGGTVFFALKGNKTREFWRYILPAALGPAPLRGGVAGGTSRLSALSMAACPNPARAGSLTLLYGCPRPGPARVALLDVSGRVVARHRFFARQSGALRPGWTNIVPGVYFVTFSAARSRLTRKLIIQP